MVQVAEVKTFRVQMEKEKTVMAQVEDEKTVEDVEGEVC
jgi:hypothetical protein